MITNMKSFHKLRVLDYPVAANMEVILKYGAGEGAEKDSLGS